MINIYTKRYLSESKSTEPSSLRFDERLKKYILLVEKDWFIKEYKIKRIFLE